MLFLGEEIKEKKENVKSAKQEEDRKVRVEPNECGKGEV